MSLSINAEQLADTAFVLFVVFTCGYSLLANREQNTSRSKKWIHELNSLQETIRELIGEASSASSHLDRTLQRRKLELEKLLVKIEGTQNQVSELPNSSWEDRPINNSARPQHLSREQQRPAATRTTQGAPKNASRQQSVLQRRPLHLTQDSELARRIETFLEDTKPSRMAAEDSSDPAAYKIARRLLESGKEIHIVAKKVGLPLEEIRVLDSMIKGEAEPVEEMHLVRAIEPTTFSAPTYSRAKQLVALSEQDYAADIEEEEIGYEQAQTQIRRATTFL